MEGSATPEHHMTDPVALSRAPRPLRATYRLQLHAGFGFDAARAVVPYLARLGVSHLYLSPVFAARPGSTHGYDVVDPRIANPELGGDAAFRELAAEAVRTRLRLHALLRRRLGGERPPRSPPAACLLYTSDAADEL